MGIIRSQSIRSTFFIYISMLIGYFNLIILMPQYFTGEEIGMTRTIIVLALVLTQFADLGTTNIIYRFFSLYEKQKAKDFLLLVLGIPLAGYIIVSSISFIFEEQLFGSFYSKCPSLKQFGFLIYTTTFFTLLSSLGGHYCAVHLKTVIPRTVNELVPRIGNTILILCYGYKIIDFATYFISFTVLVGISAGLVWVYIFYLDKFKVSLSISNLTRRLYKKILLFGLIGILGNSFSTIVSYIDTLMLGAINGQHDVAIFNIGYYIIGIMSVPYNSILAVVMPLLSRAIRQKDWDTVDKYYKQTSLNNFLIGAFIFGGIIYCFDDFIKFLPQNQGYDKAFYIIIFFGFGRIIDMITGCNSEIIAYSKHYLFNFYSLMIISIFCVFSNYFFISRFGIFGVAVSGLLSLILFNLGRYFFIKIKFGLQPFNKSTLIAIISVALTTIFCYLTSNLINVKMLNHLHSSAFLNIIIKGLVWTLIFATSIIVLKPSNDITNLFNMILNKFKISQK
ncbi:MAG: polysaccharide biosynthesis C-terminal domain-containing protein [Saprospiraceae bacterium]|nr:polysaccharide biosynthesis C-terminal domain-containing protein [Candidatus Vicinibacter proximus]MBL7823466.1 polysaccharide biosynthesis C-terminal domain-containing protein [Saprospiraceae bacterium]